MNQFKRAKVIMLPTNKMSLNSICCIRSDKPYLMSEKNSPFKARIYDTKELYHIYFNLCIVSDDEIKKGKKNEWYYDSNFNKITKWIGESNTYTNKWFKKIIATTDTSLELQCDGKCAKYECVCLFPQPSQQFIEKYIESYNSRPFKQDVITDILVEYELGLNNIPGDYNNIINLKINPKDNTITIKKLKNTWNNDEMYSNMQYYMEYCQRNEYITPQKWIEENL